MERKTLIIGLDGATFELIMPWIEEGRLPVLGKLIKDGVHGTLESTIPPVTIPAWPAMFTGKNPGKLGIFSLLKEDNRRFRPINSNDCDGRRMWSYMSDKGIRSAIINVPATYPPDKINGIMVAGLGADINGEYTYPAELKQEINQIVDDYEIDFYGFHRSRIDRFLDMLYKRTEKRKRLIMELLERKEWDFGFVVFTGSDRIQHYMWDTYEKEHPLHEKGHEDDMPRYWEHLDRTVGDILKRHAKDANVLIVSDHGFHGMRGRFNVNDWLIKEGYLVVRKKKNRKVNAKNFGITKDRAKAIMWKMNMQKFRKKIPGFIAGRIEKALKEQSDETEIDKADIDWEKTTAYSFDYVGGIMIRDDLKENEKERIRQEIVKKMPMIDNPLTGKKLSVRFFDPREVYSGEHVSEAPDIMFFVEALRYTTQVSIGHKDIIEPLTPDKPSNATHNMNGIFIAHGPDIAVGKEIANARITDIAPTVLHMFSLPIPDDMDGKVLDIFRKGSGPGKRKPARYKAEKHAGERTHKGTGDEEKMKQRLKELGYM